MKFNKIRFIFILLIFSISLLSQYDEKTIYLKQADNLTKRKQYEKANEIYEIILEKYPIDYRVVRKLINNFLITSKLEKAENLLDKHQSIFPEIDQTTLRITILIREGKPAKAYNLAKNFLKDNSGKINYYRVISSVFEQNRQNENAIKIQIKARNIAGDEYLFTRELAANYQNVKEYDKAIQEYLKHLEQNKSYFHYVVNQVKRILDDDEKQVKAVEEFAENSENEQVIEVVALSLAYIGKYEKAILQYDLLDKNKLKNFADEQFAADNFEVAEQAYNQYIQKIKEPNLIADARIKIAQMFILQNNLEEAEKILLQIYNDKELQKVKYRYRTKANRFCREILANIAIRQNESNELILNYLYEAKFYTHNQKEQKEVEFEIIHFLIMTDHLEAGKEKLRNLLYEEEQGSGIFKLGYYYSFLIAEMENDEAADSLLGELIINIPENELVNNALLFSLITTNLQGTAREDFLDAFRKRQLYKIEESINLLFSIYEETQNEEMLILAGDWAWQSGDFFQAEIIFSQEFKNEILADYALLKLTQLTYDREERNVMITEFLKTNSQSVFSPGFRQLLEEKQ